MNEDNNAVAFIIVYIVIFIYRLDFALDCLYSYTTFLVTHEMNNDYGSDILMYEFASQDLLQKAYSRRLTPIKFTFI